MFILSALASIVVLAAPQPASPHRFFPFQAIDTMKFSRDVAREKLNDAAYDKSIDTQVRDIAATGATHVAIATPYDEEFVPFLTRWVAAARTYKLHVWFRGNLSGWEGWFNYPSINREEHTKQVHDFIIRHPDLFEDGDVFSSCPECENGGPGDPRMTGDAPAYRTFLINEYRSVKSAFNEIHKDVTSNYYSMNGDVAKLIMDRETTRALDGIVTVDHYVGSPEELARDIKRFADESGGKVILGEFGAPIPDIHGDMNEDEQAAWISDTLEKLSTLPQLAGVSYWVNRGGSTALWSEKGVPRKAVETITRYYNPMYVSGTITDELGFSIDDVHVTVAHHSTQSIDGTYEIPALTGGKLTFEKEGYITRVYTLPDPTGGHSVKDVILIPQNPSFWYQLAVKIPFLRKFF